MVWLTDGKSSAGGTDGMALRMAGKCRLGLWCCSCSVQQPSSQCSTLCLLLACCMLLPERTAHCMRLSPCDPKHWLAAPFQACTVAGCSLGVFTPRPVSAAACVAQAVLLTGCSWACLTLFNCVASLLDPSSHQWFLLCACLVRRKGGAKTCRYRW